MKQLFKIVFVMQWNDRTAANDELGWLQTAAKLCLYRVIKKFLCT
jgi:hypothetical protein